MYLAIPRAQLVDQDAELGAVATTGDGGRIQAALDWIAEHYAAYLALGSELQDMAARAAAVEAIARQDGDRATVDAAATVQDAIASIFGRWRWSAEQMAWVASKIPGLGAWVVPVAVSGVALLVAAVAAVVIHDAGKAERVLDLLEAGQLSVDQARQLGLDVGGSPFFQFSAGVWSAVAAGAFAWWWARRK